ncbi:UDP-N-acetylmuramate dehydrogenase [Lachnospiraceae bacterium 62-35]
MNKELFLEQLCEAAGKEAVKRNEPMKKHTTFHVGGPADYFVSPEDEQHFLAAAALCRKEGMPCYIVGNGSNLLVSEEGFRGVMMETGKGLCYIREEEGLLKAGAGIFLSTLAKEALRLSLTGLEWASGIPGTLGGAVVMNAGAYGSEIRDVLVSVRVLDLDGTVKEISAEELQLGYRSSIIPSREYIMLEAALRLPSGNRDEIKAQMEELAAKRKARQPLEYPSAGSTFKRPAGYFAGKLIEDAGLRGFRVGDAQVSEKHCGFVINRGQARADEVMDLCRQVRQRVYDAFGVELELEIKCLGDFGDREGS